MLDGVWLVFIECDFDGYCVYYDYLLKGKFLVEYMVWLNNVGMFGLLLMCVEVLYVLFVYGLWLNVLLIVKLVDVGK